MGTRAVQAFVRAKALGGLRAKIRLATLSRVTSTESVTVDETPEVLARIERALATVEVEFGDGSKYQAQAADALEVARTGATDKMLRRHIASFLELMAQRALILGDPETAYARVTEASAQTLDVARVSVWLVDETVAKIRCVDLFIQNPPLHSSGLELLASDYAPYFAALKAEKTIAAHDAHKDPRTSCFSKGYLTPLGITSLLDVPIWVGNKMIGVICHEHIGPKRTWNSDEEQFAYLMANFLSLALES